MQSKALSWIHCEPILYDFYNGSFEEHELLAKMILHAIENGTPCERNLAIKNFFIFDNLFWVRDSEIHHRISEFIEKEARMKPGSIHGSLSHYNWEENATYCQKTEMEVQSLYYGQSWCEGRCKKIDLEVFERRAEKIEDTIRTTDKCLTSLSNKKVIKVNSKTLNLRKAPTTSSAVVSKLHWGEFLRVVTSKNGWHQVVDTKCNKGWVADYLTDDARNN